MLHKLQFPDKFKKYPKEQLHNGGIDRFGLQDKQLDEFNEQDKH